MKLADALLLRSDINKRLSSLMERIKGNCLVQDGEVPGEDPQKLMEEAFRLHQELEQLIGRINRTNVVVKLANQRTMMESIVERDRLTGQHKLLKEAASACQTTQESHKRPKPAQSSPTHPCVPRAGLHLLHAVKASHNNDIITSGQTVR